MSEDTDDAQKTEDPTQKKLDDGRRRGQVAVSRELNTWLMLTIGAIVLGMMAPTFMNDIRLALVPYLSTPDLILIDPANAGQQLFDTFKAVFGAIFFPLLFFFLIAMLGPILQNGFVYSPKALEPKFEKFDPIRGAKRLVSIKQTMEFVKGVIKLAIVGTVGILAVMPALDAIDIVPTLAIPDFLSVLHELVMKMLVAILAVLLVIAVADVVFQRQQHHKQMRMTKQEVKDEFKQSEGDPTARQRLRQIRQDRARARMMQAVPDADVVVTNPTHYAVALKYKPDEMTAPMLVAKGADLIALKIREVAEENDIAIVENPPLARALFSSVDLDEEVPQEHYQAVAEIISYVWNLEGRTMPKETPSAG